MEDMAARLADQVFGFDVHPVAVIFARVTYLLGLGPALTGRRGAIVVPVFLGDALQWNVRRDELEQDLIVDVPPDPAQPLFGASSLRFPLSLCERMADFDRVIALMESAAAQGRDPETFVAQARRQGVLEDELRTLERTYADFKTLRDHGRDHIWTYVARNLSRPVAVSQGRKMDVIVGNPAVAVLPLHVQAHAEALSRVQQGAGCVGVGPGRGQARHPDRPLRAILRQVGSASTSGVLRARNPVGRIAMVLPLAAMTRGQFKAFRSGAFTAGAVSFDRAWVLDNQDIQPLFRVPTCVLFATRSALPKPVPAKATSFVGRLPNGRKDASEAEAARYVRVFATDSPAVVSFKKGSVYRDRFRQGATLVPRMLCFVDRVAGGRLGVASSAPIVRSKRSTQEKKPWRDLPGLEGPVEAEFLRPVLLGESIAPFRVLGASEAVIPMLPGGDMLNGESAAKRGFPHLSRWLEQADRLVKLNGTGRAGFSEQINHIGKLSAQAETKLIRVVFSASGTLPAAAILQNSPAVVEHKLYWAAVGTLSEACYLTAILNSDAARRRIAHLQSRGEQGARDFDKLFFTLPIPRFDPKDDVHVQLAAAAAEAETIAAGVALDRSQPFVRSRTLIRQALVTAGVSPAIDALVDQLLGPDTDASPAAALSRLNAAARGSMLAEAQAWIALHRDDPLERALAEEAEYVQTLNGGLDP